MSTQDRENNSLKRLLLAALAQPLDTVEFLRGYEDGLLALSSAATIQLCGMEIHAPHGVYKPHERSSTLFFLQNFPAIGLDKPQGRLLEIGCGAGAISLLAAKAGWDVVASDINPDAVRATVENAERNAVSIDVRQSDLFDDVGAGHFDVIVFNEPFFQVDREVDLSEIALAAHGADLHKRFMSQATSHLAKGGRVLFSYANCADPTVLDMAGWNLDVCALDYERASNYVRAIFEARPVTSKAAML